MATSRSVRSISHILAGGIGALFCLVATGFAPAQAQVLPSNPDMTCTVAQSTFNSWFKSGTPAANGAVNAADSLALDTSNNCNFYKWSAQMFLWLTSPATAPYQGGRVFSSQAFYQVNGDYMVPQEPGVALNLKLRAAQAGPDGLPVVIDSTGHLREFVTATQEKSGAMTLGVERGRKAQVFSVKRGADGKAMFLDRNGKAMKIVPRVTTDMLPKNTGRLGRLLPRGAQLKARSAAAQRQAIADALTKKHVLIKFGSGKNALFVEADTSVVDNLGPGQAGGNGVLLSQQGSVIFYETIVNDVYAWYLTGRKTPTNQGGIAPYYYGCQPIGSCKYNYGLFPTTPADLQAVLDFAESRGMPPAAFTDKQALAIEAKLSWVDASTLPSTQGYITTQANVPVYDRSNPTDWSPAGSKLTTVALVGVHIVGGTKGHPEMVWATFEHQDNTPLAAYQYLSGGNTVTVPQNTSGNWLFSASGATGSFNAELAKYVSQTGHIVATPGSDAIAPSNILREKAWGVASNGIPNQEDTTPAAANTEVISLDTDVRNKLSAAGASADPRYNYLLIGSTWTFGGDEPTGPYPANDNSGDQQQYCSGQTCNVIGTSMLMNSTMETFQQGTDTTFQNGTDCFGCHSASGSDPNVKADTYVSHIFGSLNPLQYWEQGTKSMKKK